MDNLRDLLGSNIVRSARIGDRIISILHNGELGAILFFAILPQRMQQVLRECSRSYEVQYVYYVVQCVRVDNDDHEEVLCDVNDENDDIEEVLYDNDVL